MTRACKLPIIGESEACAAFALTSKAAVEIELLEVKDTDGNDMGEAVHFRLWDIKGQANVASPTIKKGAKFTYTNNSDGVLDLVVYAKGQQGSLTRNIRFTYTK